MQLVMTMCQAICLWNFILGLGIEDTIAWLLKMFCDNSTIVSFSGNTRSSYCSKHIEIKYIFAREEVMWT